MRSRLSLPLDRTAALFIDLQEEHRRDPGFLAEGFDRVIANAESLQRAARAGGVPLFHYAYVVDGKADAGGFRPTKADGRPAFSDKDDPNSAICPEVAPLGDPSFGATTLKLVEVGWQYRECRAAALSGSKLQN